MTASDAVSVADDALDAARQGYLMADDRLTIPVTLQGEHDDVVAQLGDGFTTAGQRAWRRFAVDALDAAGPGPWYSRNLGARAADVDRAFASAGAADPAGIPTSPIIPPALDLTGVSLNDVLRWVKYALVAVVALVVLGAVAKVVSFVPSRSSP